MRSTTNARFMIAMAALLNCVLAEAADVDQEERAGLLRVGEAAPKPLYATISGLDLYGLDFLASANTPSTDGIDTDKSAADKPAKKKSAEEKPTANGVAHNFLKDRKGQPITIGRNQRVFDSEGKELSVTEVPLERVLVCSPPPESSRSDKEVPINDYDCRHVVAAPNKKLRILGMKCIPPKKPCCGTDFVSGCCNPL